MSVQYARWLNAAASPGGGAYVRAGNEFVSSGTGGSSESQGTTRLPQGMRWNSGKVEIFKPHGWCEASTEERAAAKAMNALASAKVGRSPADQSAIDGSIRVLQAALGKTKDQDLRALVSLELSKHDVEKRG